jgi:hypothetical protein
MDCHNGRLFVPSDIKSDTGDLIILKKSSVSNL